MAYDLLTERTYDTMQPLVDRTMTQMPQVQQFYSDGLEIYQTLVYWRGRHKAMHTSMPDKSQTYTVEGVNADLRCYVSALLRRNRCFARSAAALKRLLRLFVTTYNRFCLFKFQHPKRHAALTDFLPALF